MNEQSVQKKKRGRPKIHTAEIEADVRRLREESKTIREIVALTGASLGAVHKILRAGA